MKLLAIETSCDETAISILDAAGTLASAEFTILGDALYSQATLHAAYGGVFPSLAKREHAANLVPLLDRALEQANMRARSKTPPTDELERTLTPVLARETGLSEALVSYLGQVEKPPIDRIAFTYGPGLEPALWVGINFARALSLAWDIPLMPVDHIEGHLVASAVERTQEDPARYVLGNQEFPAVSLVISGGHTEFIHIGAWGTYEIIGSTRDDSVGEAFDKVARLLDIPYPGGPGLSRAAAQYRSSTATRAVHTTLQAKKLPRPMLHSDDLDLSFSGLKTAVLYWVRELGELDEARRGMVAAAFEDAVTDVLIQKAARAIEHVGARSFLLGGGVSANTFLRTRLTQHLAEHAPGVALHVPAHGLSTDNAVMIGMAGYLGHLRGAPTRAGTEEVRAQGNLRIDAK